MENNIDKKEKINTTDNVNSNAHPESVTETVKSNSRSKRKKIVEDTSNVVVNKIVKGLQNLYALRTEEDITKVFKWYTTDVLESAKGSSRLERYQEYDYMDKNCSVISSALDWYADETVQLGRTDDVITVYSNDQVLQVYLEDKIEKLNLAKKIRSIARNLAKFGDVFIALDLVPGEGIVDIEFVDPEDFERLSYKDTSAAQELVPNIFAPENLKRIYTNFDIKFLREKLIGFKIKNRYVIPPWNGIHFRIYESDREFFPYGRAIIEAVRPTYRQYLASIILLAISSTQTFNKIKFEVKTNASDPVESFNRMEKVRQMYNENILYSSGSTYPNPIGLTESLWTTDLIKVEPINTKADTTGIDKAELFKEELFTALRIPKDYLLASKTIRIGEGVLIREDVQFARLIYTIQSAILAGLVDLLKIDIIVSNKFSEDTLNSFALDMVFPVPKFEQELAQAQNERYKLAAELIKHIKEAFGYSMSEKVNPQIVKYVLKKLVMLPEDEVNLFLSVLTDTNLNKKETEKSIPSSPFEALINAKSGKRVLKEGFTNNRHYCLSLKSSEDFIDTVGILNSYKKEKLMETIENKDSNKEVGNAEAIVN